MGTLNSGNSLKEEIKLVEELGEKHLVKYFEDLLKGYRELKKKSIDEIIDDGVSPESTNNAYEYVYTFGALLNMYKKIQLELSVLMTEGKSKEIMLLQRDDKIDGITETYSKNLSAIMKELRKHKEKIVSLEHVNEEKLDNGEIKINYFDISQLDDKELVQKYIEGTALVAKDIDKFLSDNFFEGLIDKLNIISNLKVNNKGSIDDSNIINEIGENFFELITVFGELRSRMGDVLELEKKTIQLETKNEGLLKKESKLEDKLEKNNELYLSLEMDNKVLDSDNEKMHKENRKLRIDIENLGVILGLGPVNIKTITEFIKKQKDEPKDLGPEILGKAMGIISEDKSYLVKQVELEKEKNRKHLLDKRNLEFKLEQSNNKGKELLKKQSELENKMKEMTKLIADRNIENTKDGYTPDSVSLSV